MNDTWSKFDRAYDTSGLSQSVKERESGKSAAKRDAPYGDYEIKIEKLDLTSSKKGDPMFSCWMQIIQGGYQGSRLFLHQLMTTDYGIHLTCEFLRSLKSGVPITFDSYSQFGGMLSKIMSAIDRQLEYHVKYSANDKGYSTYDIVEVYEVGAQVGGERFTQVNDDDLPF